MMTVRRKRLIVELAATAIASPMPIIVLARTGAWSVLLLFVRPFLGLTYRFGNWINTVFPLYVGGWFEGLGIILPVEFLPPCILVWMILFAMVRLIERLIFREKRDG